MYRPIRRMDRALEDNVARAILEAGSYGILSFIDASGYPCGIPFNYAVSGDALYIHIANTGGTVASLTEDGRASFCVVTRSDIDAPEFSTNYASVVTYGWISFVEGEDKIFGLKLILDKYASEHTDRGLAHIDEASDNCKVMKFNIEHLTGKARKFNG